MGESGIDSYKITADGVEATVSIEKQPAGCPYTP